LAARAANLLARDNELRDLAWPHILISTPDISRIEVAILLTAIRQQARTRSDPARDWNLSTAHATASNVIYQLHIINHDNATILPPFRLYLAN
jgi:hypothetical protein